MRKASSSDLMICDKDMHLHAAQMDEAPNPFVQYIHNKSFFGVFIHRDSLVPVTTHTVFMRIFVL